MKKNLILALLLIPISVISQNKEAIKYFDLGVEAYNQKNYKIADSLFILSTKLEPHKDTYFNLAVTKNKLGDYCGFCENLYNASIYSDSNALELYLKNCITKNKIFYNNIKEKDVVYYCIVSSQKCINKNSYQFFKKYESKDSSSSFIVIVSDTSKFKEEDFLSSSFEIENVSPENIVYLFDEMPSFPGGDDARMNYLSNNLHYPKKAVKYNIKGTVYVTFVVETDGSLTDVKILNGIGGGCDEEALRVVKLMPKWNPGKKKGNYIRVKYYMPIKFMIKVYKEKSNFNDRQYE